MALPIINNLYRRMGQTFTKVFGEKVFIVLPESLGTFTVDAVISPGNYASQIRGDSEHVRDLWTISMRRQEIASILPPEADLIDYVMRSRVITGEGRTFLIDDVADDTKIMIEGILYTPPDLLTQEAGGSIPPSVNNGGILR